MPILGLLLAAFLAWTTPVRAQTSCAAAIRDFQRVIDADVQTGNLNKSVYVRIGPQLAPVTESCHAGREADAMRALHTVKDRFGYR